MRKEFDDLLCQRWPLTQPITIVAKMREDVAYQLAQFCKRATFENFLELTDEQLGLEERKRLAYKMCDVIAAVQAALADVGFGPR